MIGAWLSLACCILRGRILSRRGVMLRCISVFWRRGLGLLGRARFRSGDVMVVFCGWVCVWWRDFFGHGNAHLVGLCWDWCDLGGNWKDLDDYLKCDSYGRNGRDTQIPHTLSLSNISPIKALHVYFHLRFPSATIPAVRKIPYSTLHRISIEIYS